MTELDLNVFKEYIRDSIRDNIMPKNTFPLEEFTLSTTINFEIAQSFIPYSSVLGTLNSYSGSITLVLKKYGTPDEGLSVYLESSSSDLPSGTALATGTVAVGDVGTVSTTIPIPATIATNRLGTKTEYWIRVVPNNTASTVNYFSIYRDTIDTNYWRGTSYSRESGGSWTASTKDLYFDFKTPNWIFADYPRPRLSLWSYPRVAVDIVGRPRSVQRYINHKISEYHLIPAISVYSRYPDETDDIVSDIDRALFRNRTEISSIDLINPDNFTPITPTRNNLFVRAIKFDAKIRITAP